MADLVRVTVRVRAGVGVKVGVGVRVGDTVRLGVVCCKGVGLAAPQVAHGVWLGCIGVVWVPNPVVWVPNPVASHATCGAAKPTPLEAYMTVNISSHSVFSFSSNSTISVATALSTGSGYSTTRRLVPSYVSGFAYSFHIFSSNSCMTTARDRAARVGETTPLGGLTSQPETAVASSMRTDVSVAPRPARPPARGLQWMDGAQKRTLGICFKIMCIGPAPPLAGPAVPL